MYEERIKYDKKDPRNYIFKIILNSAFGLSNEINGYLYDPRLMLQITVNGQLSILMLIEALSISIPNIKFLQFNTDGITYIYNKKYTNIVEKIKSWWQSVTKQNLEYNYYNKMVILDVNNYLAEDIKGNVKRKGCFEHNMPLFKNTSSLIIPKALEQYFINNLTPTEYILNKDNSIFDFCIGVKKKSNFKINLIQNFNFAELITEQQKVCRYIISKQTENSGLLVKDFDTGKRVSVEANTQVQPLDFINPDILDPLQYPINFDWYIKKTQEVIEKIKPSVVQQILF